MTIPFHTMRGWIRDTRKRALGASLCGVLVLSLLGASHAGAASVARGYNGTQIFSTVGGDKDPGEPNHCGVAGGASSWFCYQAPIDGIMLVDTKGSSFDTVLAVYTGPGTDFASLVSVACNNDASPTDTWSQVMFPAVAGTMYFIAVDGANGASGTVKLNYFLGIPPSITNAPQTVVAPVGGTAFFSAAAAGSIPLTYQWQFNGVDLPAATNTILNLTNVQYPRAGEYQVQARNAVGAATRAASLYVCAIVPPTNGLTSQRMSLNSQPLFRVVANAAAGSVLEASSDMIHWQPIQTNLSSQGLFLCDEPITLPVRFYRIRLAQ